MTPTRTADCCPHCGSKEGYQTKVVVRYARAYRWDGKDADSGDCEVLGETDPRCQECGKAVRSLFKTEVAP